MTVINDGSFAIVADGDEVGALVYTVDDGTDYVSEVARIAVHVDGTPGENDTPGRIVFATTADGAYETTERMRIDSTGLLTLASGQIKFPATQNASSNANTLDDYEEGTFTLTYSGISISYGSQTGYYTKVGNLVTAYGYINCGSQTTGTGTITILGLPFINHASAPYASCTFGQLYQVDVAAGSPGDITGHMNPNTAVIGLFSNHDDANYVALTGTAINSANCGVMFSITYCTDS